MLQEGLEAIKIFYKNLSKKYGYPIDVPESAYFNLANYVYNQVSTEAAVDISKLYVDVYPESSFAHYRLGRFYHLMGKLELAIKSYQKAIALEKKTLDPDSERLVTYNINLENADKELMRKEEKRGENRTEKHLCMSDQYRGLSKNARYTGHRRTQSANEVTRSTSDDLAWFT